MRMDSVKASYTNEMVLKRETNTKYKTAENSRSRHQRDERRMVIIKEKSSRNKRGHGEPKGADEKGLSE